MQEKLIRAFSGMGIALTPAQADAFAEYHRMLTEANKQMNLTRVPDDPDEAVDRNYLDSAAPLLGALPEGLKTLSDVGSGAGFPGIPLAILLPDVEIALIDALDKRVKFLQDVIKRLGLNARAVHARAEDAGRKADLRGAFDVVTSRAVASLNVLCELSSPLLKEGGRMIAYKGPTWEEELAQAQNALTKLNLRHLQTQNVEIPGRDWNHVLLLLEKCGPTPDQYPRRAGVPEKKPL